MGSTHELDTSDPVLTTDAAELKSRTTAFELLGRGPIG
jgi:hypothetical protein